MSSDQIQPGMPVYGADNQLVGTISATHGDHAMGMIEIDCDGGQCRVPATAIERVAAGNVYLPNPADQYRSQPHARAVRADDPESAEALPLPPGVDEFPVGSNVDQLPRTP